MSGRRGGFQAAAPVPVFEGMRSLSRILAFDLGKRRIGLALTDPLGITAQGMDTFERTNIREDLARLSGLVREKDVSLMLFGNPLHMSGRESKQTEYVREFAERLSAVTQVGFILWDERLTSVEAERMLREGGVGDRRDRKGKVDRLSAVILLNSYLGSLE